MKITALQEYGMRCLLQLAEGDERPMQIRTIAGKEGLSQDYVGKILTRLRRMGLVKSVRGLNGGYILARKPSEITMGEAILSLSEKPINIDTLKKDLCGQFPGNRKECIHLQGCNVRQVWSMVMLEVYKKLNSITLESLLGPEKETLNLQSKFRIKEVV